jgi:ATP-dependent Clp protease ATP-binding subunit ClpX
MISSVSPLDRDALIRILIEPRNALVKQFKKLFDLDGVELEFTSDAIEAIADLALLRGTGARGLRAILEEVLLNVMYDVPSSDDVGQVIISAEVVKDNALPTLVPREKFAKRERRERSA